MTNGFNAYIPEESEKELREFIEKNLSAMDTKRHKD